MLLLLIASMDIASTNRISLTQLSFAAAKDLGPGAIIGVVSYQRRRIVAYSAYIFKAFGVTSAWGLYGMHPGPRENKGFGTVFRFILSEQMITHENNSPAVSLHTAAEPAVCAAVKT